MGLKKGPWSSEEDHILVNYIQLHGHGNWRALPKQAGLLRCGKSCRLRWTNYLRPDIKRGNFSPEEEHTIIQLHQELGNRWSAIAAQLPGRTDNEIKNVWHTHLKKRLKTQKPTTAVAESDFGSGDSTASDDRSSIGSEEPKDDSNSRANDTSSESPACRLGSPHRTSSDMSSVTVGDINCIGTSCDVKVESPGHSGLMDEDFWSEVLSTDNSGWEAPGSVGESTDHPELDDFFPLLSDIDLLCAMDGGDVRSPNTCDGMAFWFDLFARAGDLTPELPGP